MSTQSHYSLRWNNHQSHILAAFDALLQSETLVDVTLVCAETSVRAHKVVLSACSPFFQRVFSENPCKHPVIVLKDFSGWEVQAIVDFMYKGEISVVQEQLQSLIKAAESLQVRGLAQQDPFGVDKDSTSIVNQTPTPSASPNDFDRNYFTNGKFPIQGAAMRTPSDRQSPFSPIQNNYEPTVKLPHMPRLSFPDALMPRQDCQSPIPRRKQARPRRRSGELCGAQDLTTGSVKADTSPTRSTTDEMAENLCVKRPKTDKVKEERKSCTPEPHVRSPDLDPNTQSSGKDFRTSPINNMPTQPAPMNLKQEIEQHQQNSNNHQPQPQQQPSPMTFPPMPAVSALAMTPPHSKFFGLDSPLGLFPPGLENCRNPLFDMGDPRTTVDSSMFIKKKMGRPKGQHSAPRGGPPRSWTNAELTEALQHVWNKKMTTSQASRIFGIPYNSLLMYVRGKYGKSLKLEQLRKDCIEGPNAPTMEAIMSLGSNNNNNLMKPVDRNQDPIQPNTRPSSRDQDQTPQPPVFNPFAHNFYPDFGTGFPIPVSMIHLLPQSDRTRLDHGPYGQTPPDDVDYSKNEKDINRDINSINRERDIRELRERMKEIEEESPQDMFRTHNLQVDDRKELLQHNGQD